MHTLNWYTLIGSTSVVHCSKPVSSLIGVKEILILQSHIRESRGKGWDLLYLLKVAVNENSMLIMDVTGAVTTCS